MHGLKARRYAACLIDLNEYLDYLPGDTLSDKIGKTELYEFLLNCMPNSWSKQAYVKVLDCEYISFKKYVNMFELMDIFESIYEGVVEPSYKKSTWAYPNRDYHRINKIGEAAL